MHKRADHQQSRPLDSEPAQQEVVVRSPAKERAADADLKRATCGLIRLGNKRRYRTYLRRIVVVVLLVSLVAGLWHYLGEYVPTERLTMYWEELRSKLPPLDEASR